MGEGSAKTGYTEARAMIDAFASVGAMHFDVTLTTRAGDKDWFRRDVTTTELRRTLPAMLVAAAKLERNVIVRPHGERVSFIQLDDLKTDQLPPLARTAFLTIWTCPGFVEG